MMSFQIDPALLENKNATPRACPEAVSQRGYSAGENVLSWMREVGRDAGTSASMLRQLAASNDPEVKISVADHANAPLEVLMMLASDENADVRYALAESHNISRLVLEKLCDDENPFVVCRAQRTLARLKRKDTKSLSWFTCRAAYSAA